VNGGARAGGEHRDGNRKEEVELWTHFGTPSPQR
jgi:hypothetical protein